MTEKLAFEEWPSPLFEGDFWQSTMHGFSVLLALALAALLLLEFAVRRGHGHVPPRLVNRVSALIIALGFLVYYDGFNPNTRHPGLYSPSAFYQQYVGTKYRAELPNDWLFECTIAAEKELGGRRHTIHGRYIRSQVDPEQLVPAATAVGALQPELCTTRFSAARWESFKTDIEWFTQAVEREEWSGLHQARWFVASPGWSTVVRPLVNAPVSEVRLRWLSLIDPALHLLALVAMVWGFGVRIAAVGAVTWGAQPFVPFVDGVGLLQNAWIALLVIGLCALRRKRRYGGAMLLAVASALNPWVLVTFIAAAASALAPLARRRSPHKRQLQAVGFWAVLLSVFFAVSAGPERDYGRFASELALQQSLPELNDVGLATILATVDGQRYRFTRNDALANPAEEWSLSRAEALGQTRILRSVLLAAFSLWLLWLAINARTLFHAAAVGAVALTVIAQPLSSAVGLLVLVPLCVRRMELAPALLLATAASEVLWTRTHFPDDRAAAASSLLLVTALVATLAISPLVRRCLSRRALPRAEQHAPPPTA